jgi:hypothetical protein
MTATAYTDNVMRVLILILSATAVISPAPAFAQRLGRTVPVQTGSPTSSHENPLTRIIQNITYEGCSKQSHDEAEKTLREILKQISPAVLDGLKRGSVRIFPAGINLTDLPEYAAYKGKTSPSGELIDGLRGATQKGCYDDSGECFVSATLVGEENLLSRGAFDERGSRSRRVLVHEYAHQIFWIGLSKSERERISNFYEDARKGMRYFTDDYASANPTEFFAKGTEAWFGLHQFNSIHIEASRLKELHPEFYAELSSIYGPPRRIQAR